MLLELTEHVCYYPPPLNPFGQNSVCPPPKWMLARTPMAGGNISSFCVIVEPRCMSVSRYNDSKQHRCVSDRSNHRRCFACRPSRPYVCPNSYIFVVILRTHRQIAAQVISIGGETGHVADEASVTLKSIRSGRKVGAYSLCA